MRQTADGPTLIRPQKVGAPCFRALGESVGYHDPNRSSPAFVLIPSTTHLFSGEGRLALIRPPRRRPLVPPQELAENNPL